MPFALGDPFDNESEWGLQMEAFTRYLAASYGIPDFVYRPSQEFRTTPSGKSSSNEVSDGLLVCGSRGVVLQSKVRGFEEGFEDDPERAKRKLQKMADEAIPPCKGSLERLCEPGGVTLTSMRGVERTIQAEEDWPFVVILTHTGLPEGFTPAHVPNTLFITPHDWHGLHSILRSTASVISYVERAVQLPELSPPLGKEYERYFTLAHAEAETANATTNGYASLPLRSIAGDDLARAQVISDWIELLYKQTLEHHGQADYVTLVEHLDNIVPGARIDIGQRFMEMKADSLRNVTRESCTVSPAGSLASLTMMTKAVPGPTNGERQAFAGQLFALTHTRHTYVAHANEDISIGVGVLYGDNGKEESPAFLMVDDSVPVPASMRRRVLNDFGPTDRNGVVHSIAGVKRNDRCPCGSGRKWKHCCEP